MTVSDNPVLKLIHARYTAEQFDDTRAVDEATVRALVEDAARAPSSFNIQHWRFVAVRGGEDKRRLQEVAYGQPQVSRSAVTFIVLGDTRAVDELPGIMDDAVAEGALPEAKAAAWVRMAREIYADPSVARDEAIRSASLAAMTMMLAAEARGLAAGALSGFDAGQVSEVFGIEERFIPVMLLAVGWPVPREDSRMPRLGADRVLRFDRWS